VGRGRDGAEMPTGENGILMCYLSLILGKRGLLLLAPGKLHDRARCTHCMCEIN
jgi:hypothetical protein